ncbi:translation initiation factor IF-2-like [Salvia hispanica]|uniref:translation initiation factor IF-2-like n=1 Tax=Salvia hispanica TaxID=49212 RepID=UPI0020093C3E|nr:translation initiation factor IF-2-like [Salvia hispanica]
MKMTHKQPSATGEKQSEDPTTMEVRPPNPQQSRPAPPPQIPAMVPLDALAAYLRQQDPNRDWTTTLAGFGQIGGMPAIQTPAPEILTTVNPPTTVPTSSVPTSKKSSPTATTPSKSETTSPVHPQIKPIDAIPLSSYQDPYIGEIEEGEAEGREGEAEGREGEAEGSEKGGDKSEETPVTKTTPQEEGKGEIDLNETAKKQGLMTDDEFQSILNRVHRGETSANEMAEGMDLASQAVGEASRRGGRDKQPEEERQKSETPQFEAKEGEKGAEKEAEVQPEEPETIAPTVSKPKQVKRKLVLKNDPKAKRQKPKRVSQRCLGKWTSSKAGANIAADAVEISSEDERTTPTKPGEEPSTTSQEEAPMATGMVPPTLVDQEEEADKVAEGLDLEVSRSRGDDR